MCFLEKGLSSEATKTMVNMEDVSCLWKEVVHDTVVHSTMSSEKGNERQHLKEEKSNK